MSAVISDWWLVIGSLQFESYSSSSFHGEQPIVNEYIYVHEHFEEIYA